LGCSTPTPFLYTYVDECPVAFVGPTKELTGAGVNILTQNKKKKSSKGERDIFFF
jgi:hypothetical protein